MHHRIGSMHLHYRVRDDAVGALVPAFDRAVQNGLSDAIEARMSAALVDDASVVVIRELSTAIVLAGQDTMLDSRVVERVCQSSVDAVVDALARAPDSDTLARFADEAEFIGTFIVDLLAGVAWDRWYYGAFRRHRKASVVDTIRDVLTDTTDAARVLAWLSRRGKLDRIMALLSAPDVLSLIRTEPLDTRRSNAGDGTDVLVDAAFRLLDALGVGTGNGGRDALLRRFPAAHAIDVDWRDRRALSANVLQLMRFVLVEEDGDVARLARATPAMDSLLSGPLDWLDGQWLVQELEALVAIDVESSTGHLMVARERLTAHQSRLLDRIAAHVREGRLRIPLPDGADAIVVRLIAAAAGELGPGSALGATLMAAFDAIARVVRTHSSRDPDDAPDVVAQTSRSRRRGKPQPADVQHRPARVAVAPLARYGKAAVSLARALTGAPNHRVSEGEATSSGGLFLLLRGLLDARLPAVAREFEVPLAPLLGALAHQWFAPPEPFDQATALWVGADQRDVAALDNAADRLQALNAALLEMLVVRQGADEHAVRESIGTNAPLTATTAALLMRLWAFWLRGISASSAQFLLDNCLRRDARVRITDDAVHVDLDPAPLDVVLQMAGYFERIDCIPWLGNRCVTFAVRRPAQG